jgi:hypothetical protein
LDYAHDSSDNQSRSVMLSMSLGVFESQRWSPQRLKDSKMGDCWRQVHTPIPRFIIFIGED